MIYQVRHRTLYRYANQVGFARCAMRLFPLESAEQAVLASRIDISPEPAQLDERRGQFGERVLTALIQQPHQELNIVARSKVAVTRSALLPGLTGAPWTSVRHEAAASTSLEVFSPAHFLYPTKLTALNGAITAYAAECFSPDRSIVEAAFSLCSRIKQEFVYDPDATQVSTPALEAFGSRRGVCQDFAHIMIGGLRGLGLPAAYVSGYLRTLPPPGKPRLEGADATHAWVNLWCGNALGWIGFDPTNALIVAGDHIVLAMGRDYSDVAPISGVVLGPGEQTIEVEVDVVPEEQAPHAFPDPVRSSRTPALS